MAYITASSDGSITSSSTITASLPSSTTGDVVILALGTYNGSTVSTIVGNNGGTWNSEINYTSGNYVRVYSCVQGATPDTEVTVTYTTSEQIVYNAITVKGCDTTTRIDTYAATNSSTITPICPSVTPSSSNTLIWCLVNSYSSQDATYTKPGLVHTGWAAASYFTGMVSGYTYHPTADATPTYEFEYTREAAQSGVKMTIAIKDDGNGHIKGYHDQSASAFDYLHMMNRWSGDLSDNTTYDPTDVANENISSISNGPYSTSNVGTDDRTTQTRS